MCEVRLLYCPSSVSVGLYSGQLGYKRLCAANSSFIIQSENRDGDLPTTTKWSRRQEKQQAPHPQEHTQRALLCSSARLKMGYYGQMKYRAETHMFFLQEKE